MDEEKDAAPQRPEDFPRYYANWVTPWPGPYDMALDFGYERGAGPDADPDPEWQATIVLAWEEVVVLRALLDRHIALYEEHAGHIRKWEVPPPIDAEDNGSPEPEED